MAILIKVLFYVWEFFGRSLVHPWFLVGLLHGADVQSTRDENIKKSAFLSYKLYVVSDKNRHLCENTNGD